METILAPGQWELVHNFHSGEREGTLLRFSKSEPPMGRSISFSGPSSQTAQQKCQHFPESFTCQDKQRGRHHGWKESWMQRDAGLSLSASSVSRLTFGQVASAPRASVSSSLKWRELLLGRLESGWNEMSYLKFQYGNSTVWVWQPIRRGDP